MTVLILFWGDDTVTVPSGDKVLNSVKMSLNKKFKMKDLGNCHDSLALSLYLMTIVLH